MMSGRDVQPRDFQHRTRSLQQQQQQQQQQEEEEEEPHHSSIMVDLRPRGRRRAAAAGLSLGLNLDLPRAGGDDRNVPVRILDENRTEAAELQLPQRLGCTSGLPVPQRISCQPPRPLPAADPPAAGSANKKEQTTWQPFIEGVEPRELGGVREEGGAKEQSMYCKDELLNGTTELSFEELRAQRYFQRKRQERNEELKQLDAEKQQLRQQLEHKQRLLQLHKTQEAPGSTCRPQGATPFQVYDESQALSAAAARPSGTSRAPADVMPDDVFLRPDEKGLCLKVQLPRHSDIAAASERSHCKIFPESSESLTEDVILSGHQNKTLCSSPDNTNDFAGAAKMASTPHSGPAGPRAAGLTDHQGSVREEPRPPRHHPEARRRAPQKTQSHPGGQHGGRRLCRPPRLSGGAAGAAGHGAGPGTEGGHVGSLQPGGAAAAAGSHDSDFLSRPALGAPPTPRRAGGRCPATRK
ncbi:mitotic checkpoint serine/threonine-protein kinase BUB1 beta-like isoform X2 [Myripristis murdjan]|uniref:mitotic checkpoint serine/threonine-protein kinase BUB1 beta-like isoform X2 n=1 Tax=Myripristis murdjan TaxID=586833 RepID=UPI001176269E|nr:mitotic checkpoint serine/threonine-protein kinase BUB1 beta-like isoform X2 [Myripristis murdjan]